MLLPILIVIHISLITAILTFIKKYRAKKWVTVFNLIVLPIGLFYVFMSLSVVSKSKKIENKNEFELNSTLITEFHRDDRLNPDNSDLSFYEVDSFQVDLNNNNLADTIKLRKLKGWENDPGDYRQIQITMDNGYSWTETNFDGWVRFDNNYFIPDSIKQLNQLETDLLLLTEFEGTKILGLFGWVYASKSGLLTIIDFSTNQPRIMINKNLDLVGINQKRIAIQESGVNHWIEKTNKKLIIK